MSIVALKWMHYDDSILLFIVGKCNELKRRHMLLCISISNCSKFT